MDDLRIGRFDPDDLRFLHIDLMLVLREKSLRIGLAAVFAPGGKRLDIVN